MLRWFPPSRINNCAAVAVLLAMLLPLRVSAQDETTLPNAPGSAHVLTAQVQTPPPDQHQGPYVPPKISGQAITLELALELAKQNNPTLQANQTLILQNRAQEITANLRPNPVLSMDSQYLPLFSPSLFTDSDYWNNSVQFDTGVGYLFERGQKRQHRLEAAKAATAVTESQVSDAQRTVLASVAQAFVSALLARSNLDFALNELDSYKKTVKVSEDRQSAGAMSRNDLLKIQLQQLQFENDVTNAEIVREQALASLRQYLGFNSVAADYQVSGQLVYESMPLQLEDLQARAVNNRPDLQAARRGVSASESQVGLAKANGKVDWNLTVDYTRLSQNNLGAVYFSIPLPIFNRNQGEIARTQAALRQSQLLQTASENQVLTDVKTSYETLRSSERIVKLYDTGYLDKATQALDITRFSYEHGAASLLDFLDAERSYRSTELGYRQALAVYMTALEQLRQAVGTRDLK
jgi:cobalt-zinc-cadmium efflux system outer membrane protein